MAQEQALIAQYLLKRGNTLVENLFAVLGGLVLVGALAQISIPLPNTPVPITGQTLGIALIALLWGRKRGLSVVASYLVLGGLGLPVFASGKSGLLLGPTSGYLFGMFFAAGLMGFLADRGWTKSFLKTWFATVLGSAITFSFGVWGLSFFTHEGSLLQLGVLPFLPGDFIKSLFAASFVTSLQKYNTR
ncbi:biotin transporter BioY [Bdellovibrio sp. HCB337]|uniref:biotin transporter BioY n=1 Tax=Bdellovibrio sp. HCB337 TaxID=3394358 RepID=UPI0039A413A1